MAAPRYVQSSTGATDATGTFTFTGVATGTIGDLVIMHIVVDGTGAISWGTISGTNIANLAGTANVWTQVGGAFPLGSPTLGQQVIYMGRRTSAVAAPTFTASANTSGDDVYGQMHEFTNVSTGTTVATVIENVTAGSTVNGQATSGTIADASVTTIGPDRLALNFVGITDDNAINNPTGIAQQVWKAVAGNYADATGTDASMVCWQAYPGVASSIDSASGSNSDQINGATGTSEAIAQSFTPASDVTVDRLLAKINPSSSPVDNLIVEIQTNAADVPSGTVVGSGVTTAAAGLASFGMSAFAISAALTGGTRYWIVARRDGARDVTNRFTWTGSTGVELSGAGEAKAILASGTWTAGGGTPSFSIGLSTGNSIDGATTSNADATDGWGVVGFALIGTTVITAPTLVLNQGFSNFIDIGVLMKVLDWVLDRCRRWQYGYGRAVPA